MCKGNKVVFLSCNSIATKARQSFSIEQMRGLYPIMDLTLLTFRFLKIITIVYFKINIGIC